MGNYNLKNNLISGFSTTDPDSTISEWDSLIFQCLTTLYLLHNYRVNPDLSAYDYLYPPYNFNKFTMEPPVTCRIVYYKKWKSNSMGSSWKSRFLYWSITWILQMHAVLHARNWNVTYHWHTAIHPKAFDFPKTTTEDYLQQFIEKILAIIQDPPNKLPFLSYRD